MTGIVDIGICDVGSNIVPDVGGILYLITRIVYTMVILFGVEDTWVMVVNNISNTHDALK